MANTLTTPTVARPGRLPAARDRGVIQGTITVMTMAEWKAAQANKVARQKTEPVAPQAGEEAQTETGAPGPDVEIVSKRKHQPKGKFTSNNLAGEIDLFSSPKLSSKTYGHLFDPEAYGRYDRKFEPVPFTSNANLGLSSTAPDVFLTPPKPEATKINFQPQKTPSANTFQLRKEQEKQHAKAIDVLKHVETASAALNESEGPYDNSELQNYAAQVASAIKMLEALTPKRLYLDTIQKLSMAHAEFRETLSNRKAQREEFIATKQRIDRLVTEFRSQLEANLDRIAQGKPPVGMNYS